MAAGDVEVRFLDNVGLGGASFDGINDKISIQNAGNYSDKFTIFWRCCGTSLTSHIMARRTIVPNEIQWNLYTAGDGTLSLATTSGSGNIAINISDNVWHNCAFVCNGTKSYLWVDGIKSPAINLAGKITIYDKITTLGAYQDAAANWYKGLIADVRFYDEVLSDGNILLLTAGKTINSLPKNHFPLVRDYEDKTGKITATNSGTYFTIRDSINQNAIKTMRVGATDKWLMYKGTGKQILIGRIEG